jgi:hypothetical protein
VSQLARMYARIGANRAGVSGPVSFPVGAGLGAGAAHADAPTQGANTIQTGRAAASRRMGGDPRFTVSAVTMPP